MRLILILFVVFALPGWAEVSGANPTKPDLRALIYPGDVDRVEAMMARAHHASVAAQRYDDLRRINEAFSVRQDRTEWPAD